MACAEFDTAAAKVTPSMAEREKRPLAGAVSGGVFSGNRGIVVTGFSAEWLKLREPYDRRARNPIVLAALVGAIADRASVAIVDLACGTGATWRAISSHLARRQRWRLVDNDLGLLAHVISSAPAIGNDVETIPIDIFRELDAALEDPVDLVTTSALLDLVSCAWLERLAQAVARRGLMVYGALTFDGRITFEPADIIDVRIVEAVNQHQRREKGFGPALGPAAAVEAVTRFAALNYEVVHGASDWSLEPPDNEIQAQLVAGWAGAAREGDDLTIPEIEGWLDRRRGHILSGRSSIHVGHIDFFGRPITAR
jgi:hypothetical protein